MYTIQTTTNNSKHVHCDDVPLMVIVILCEYSPAPTLVTAWICGRTVGERGGRGEREGEGEDREGKGREGREKGKREGKREGKTAGEEM